MPQTHNEFDSVYEIALSMEFGGVLPSGHERKLVGDIIGVRKPIGYIGRKERTQYLWLLITTSQDSPFLDELGQCLTENGESAEYDKRRYCIPLGRLKAIFPLLDVGRARNTTDSYQPFLGVDEETGDFLWNQIPLSVEGLVWDKAKGHFVN